LQGFAFDVEVLALARKLKIAVTEVPVKVQDCKAPRSIRFCRPSNGLDVLRVRAGLTLDFYRLTSPAPGLSWLPGGAFVLALAVRLPWLWQVPRFIDELREVSLGYPSIWARLALHNALMKSRPAQLYPGRHI
jgi:hypothetical protein